MSLEAKAAIVTGGGRGIGAAVAQTLAAAGVRVVVSARTEVEVASVADALASQGLDVSAVACDVTEPDQVRTLVARARELVGPIQILVNNAGVSSSAPFARVRLEDWNHLFAVNATGPFLCSQAVLPDMLETGWGRIVNVASIAGKVGAPYISAYCASKHAVIGLTRALASEVADKSITVNAVCPGYVDTPMTDQSVTRITDKTGMSPDQARERLIATNPQGRLIEAQEVAWLVTSLCQPSAGGINGQAIVLDGGRVQT